MGQSSFSRIQWCNLVTYNYLDFGYSVSAMRFLLHKYRIYFQCPNGRGKERTRQRWMDWIERLCDVGQWFSNCGPCITGSTLGHFHFKLTFMFMGNLLIFALVMHSSLVLTADLDIKQSLFQTFQTWFRLGGTLKVKYSFW